MWVTKWGSLTKSKAGTGLATCFWPAKSLLSRAFPRFFSHHLPFGIFQRAHTFLEASHKLPRLPFLRSTVAANPPCKLFARFLSLPCLFISNRNLCGAIQSRCVTNCLFMPQFLFGYELADSISCLWSVAINAAEPCRRNTLSHLKNLNHGSE